MKRALRFTLALPVITLAATTTGCRQDMHDQPKFRPLAENAFFDDHRSARPRVAGTVARGHLREDDAFHTGKVNGVVVDVLPVPLTAELVRKGRARYETFCAPCHGRTGRGDGMVTQRGFKKPSSYHIDRLREMPAGYYFDVITNGFGAMSDYSAQIPVEDRWAVVAYVRALQLSQNARFEDVPPDFRPTLDTQDTVAH